MLCALADRLKAEYGMETVRVEYGPGLYFPYFNHEDHSDTLAPIRELAPNLAALAAHCELTIEMGRFFASECGAYLTRVVDTKVNGGTAYAIVDGGIHHVNYLGGNMGMRVPIIEQSPAREAICSRGRCAAACARRRMCSSARRSCIPSNRAMCWRL